MYTDSDFGGDKDTSKSTTGYIAMRGSAPLTWKASKQPLVAMSTMEAELIALTSASLCTVWLRRLLEEFGNDMTETTPIMEDNESAIYTAEAEMISRRARHIPRRFFKVRELIRGSASVGDDNYDSETQPQVRVEKIHTSKNISDSLTKNVGPQLYQQHTTVMLSTRTSIDKKLGTG